jgi:hypothetical protein
MAKTEPILDHFTQGEPGLYTAEEAASKAGAAPAVEPDPAPEPETPSEPDVPAEPTA